MAAQSAVKGVANYYCGSLSEDEYYSCTFIDRRHYPHTQEYVVPEGTPLGSEVAIRAAVDAAAASLPSAIASRSKDGEAYLVGAAPSLPVLTAAGLGVPVTANTTAVIGGGGETAVAVCCSVLVSTYRTIAIVDAHAAAHRRWGEDATKNSGCSVVMVDGACYDVNLRVPKAEDRTLTVVLVRRVAEVIVVPHMVLTDFPRPNSPCQVIVEDWSGYSRIVSIHPLHFISKVIGGCGPMGGEMRIAFLDPVNIRGVLQTIQAMRLNTAPSVNLPAEDVMLTQPTTQLLAAMHPMTHLRRMPAYEFFGGWENGDSPHSEEDFGWSVHDERREMLRWLTIYNPETVSPPDDPAQYHAYAAAGTGCDLRPWFRLSCLHPSSSDAPGDLSTTTPLIAGYGPTPTYPLRVCVPAAATDAFLIDACFPARSRQRIPAVSYVNLRTGAVLCRSSQPLKARSTATASDEELCRYMVNHYTTYNSGHRNAAGVGAPTPANTTTPGSPSGSSFSPPPSIVNRPAPPPSLTSGGTPARKQAEEQTSPQKAGGSVVTSVISTGPQTLSIVDCRPRAAAMANDTVGGGYERHDLGRVKFFGIDNIHAVTGSYAKLRQLLVAHAGMMAVAGGVGGSSGALVAYSRKDVSARQLHVLHAGGVAHSAGGSSDFHRGFWAETAWMVHIQRVLMCALETAEYIERGESALVHCTDGWDRTSQTTALAMILMDPFFRTVRGFALLIEKEFAQFGHKFAERFGHMTPNHMDTTYTSTSGVRSSDTEGGAAADATPASSKQQPSPVFMQFLDALYQIIRQFPSAFEFTPMLLIFVAEHCSSCLYGTFLCNNAKERLFEGVTIATHSIWSDVLTACDLERRGLSTPHLLEPSYDSERAMWFIQKRPKYPAPPTTPPTPPSPTGSASTGSPDWNLARAPCHEGAPVHTHNNCGIDFIRPNFSSKRLAFWEEFYLRHDPDRALLPGASTSDKSSYRVSAVVTEGHTHATLQQAMIALPLSTVSPTGMVTSRCRTQLVFPSTRLSRGTSSVYAPHGCVGAAPMFTTVSAPTEEPTAPSTNPIVLQFTTVEVCGISQRERKQVNDANLVPLTSGPMYGGAFMTWNDKELQAMKAHRKQDVREIFKVHQLAHWHRNGGVASMDQVSSLRCRLGGNHPFLLTDSDLIALPAPANVRFLGASDQGGVDQPEGGHTDPVAIQHKLKRCSQCTAQFGGALTPWLSSRHYCDSCAKGSTLAGLPLCSKCVKTTKDGRTLCINCFAIEA